MSTTVLPVEAMTEEKIKEYIMFFPPKTKLVRILDACLKRIDLECLFDHNGWLCGDVMNAYIYYLRAQEHLSNRAGGQIWLENTHISNLMHRDATFPVSASERDKVIERALKYLQHDMLFVPVNANKNHWILFNVNGPNRRIQIFDSFGSSMDHPDLLVSLQGLQNQLALAAQMSDFNLGEKWQDLEITTWPWEESIHNPLQTDGSSCGLFVLKLMEKWTGHELAHDVTQDGIKLFRNQLPLLLHDTVLNDLKGTPEYEHPDNDEDTRCHYVGQELSSPY